MALFSFLKKECAELDVCLNSYIVLLSSLGNHGKAWRDVWLGVLSFTCFRFILIGPPSYRKTLLTDKYHKLVLTDEQRLRADDVLECFPDDIPSLNISTVATERLIQFIEMCDEVVFKTVESVNFYDWDDPGIDGIDDHVPNWCVDILFSTNHHVCVFLITSTSYAVAFRDDVRGYSGHVITEAYAIIKAGLASPQPN